MMWMFWPVSRAAEPLYVEPARIDEVAAVVAVLWPGDHLTVLVRPDAIDAGFVWDGVRLLRVADGRVTYGDAPDAETAVVLARAWSRPAPEAPRPVLPPPPPPPPAPPAEPPAPARDGWQWVATTGIRQPFVGWTPEAVTFGVGAVEDHFDLRGVVGIGVGPASGAPVALAAVTGALPPFDAGSFDVLGGWNLGADRRGERVHGGPVLIAGASAASRVDRTLGRDQSVELGNEARVAFALLGGVAIDVWLGESVGVRTTLLARTTRSSNPASLHFDMIWAPRVKASRAPTQETFGGRT
jgi:hypothetical protein